MNTFDAKFMLIFKNKLNFISVGVSALTPCCFLPRAIKIGMIIVLEVTN
jgi:hypothetical protein